MRGKKVKRSPSKLGLGIFINDPISCFAGNSPRCGWSIREFFLLTLKKSRLDQCFPAILCEVVVQEDTDYVDKFLKKRCSMKKRVKGLCELLGMNV